MKMYAIRRMGSGYTTAKSMDFNRVVGIDKEKVALACNKDTKSIMEMVKYTPVQGNYLYNRDIESVRNKLLAVNPGKPADAVLVRSITDFMGVCLEKGYDIRFW